MKLNPLTAIDFYKADHRRQYPEGTTKVYSNFTARSARLAKMSSLYDNKVVFFGLQYFIKHFLGEVFNEGFFELPKKQVVKEYKRRMDTALGKDSIPVDHIEALHDLGYLPIQIKAVREGSRVNIGVPMLTITNTLPEYYWLVNYLETALSAFLWKPCTSATIAHDYRRLFDSYAKKTNSAALGFVPFQGHDFSCRGMSGIYDAALTGAGHLLSFSGTDTVSAIDLLEQYYGADADKELIGCSVPATEHSVMCMGGKETEIETFQRLINHVYPKGIVSIVSDTWDFWKVLTEILPALGADIMTREGKVVIRPDSGDPVAIICGFPNLPPQEGVHEPSRKGAVELLWDAFGGTSSAEGFNVLDDCIGLIYGDSITIERAERILEGLYKKGFASTNLVMGIGSYTYQHVTRDTFGFAVKSTYGEINGVPQMIFKDPVTDSGVKKSHKGLLRLTCENGEYLCHQEQTEDQEDEGELLLVFKDGMEFNPSNLVTIRQRLAS